MSKAKTALQRMEIMQEVENKLVDNQIEHETGSLVVRRILNIYVATGKTFINKEVKLLCRADIPRKFVINLFNDVQMRDQIVIKAEKNESV